MKEFLEFDPLHPIKKDETAQIKRRKVFLEHIPLVDSVSIRGFLPAATPSDVTANSFWVDYRFDDGYRSANGEILFDPSVNEQFVDISYLAIGTVLHAKDMNEVADSLTNFESIETQHLNAIHDLSIRAGVIDSNARENLLKHESNPDAHQSIRDSISIAQDEFNYRLNVQAARVDGVINLVDSTATSLQAKIEKIDELCDAQIEEVQSILQEKIDAKFEMIDDFRDEFTGVYNSITRLEEKFEGDSDLALEKYESLLAIERVSATTALNNAKSEVLSRAIAEAERRDESLRADIQAQAERDSDRLLKLQDQIQTLETDYENLSDKYPILQQMIEAEQRSRIQSDNSIHDSIENLDINVQDSISGIRGDVAKLADTLYQARQATNIQLESLRANVAIAEDRMIFIANQTGSLNQANIALNQSLTAELEGVTSMKSEMLDYIDGMFDPFRLEIANSVQAAIDAIPDVDFSGVESSVAAIWDSIDNIDFDTTPIEDSINMIQFSLDHIDFDTSSLESSIASNFASIGNLNTKVAALEQGGKSDLQVLTTTATNQVGAIWYST